MENEIKIIGKAAIHSTSNEPFYLLQDDDQQLRTIGRAIRERVIDKIPFLCYDNGMRDFYIEKYGDRNLVFVDKRGYGKKLKLDHLRNEGINIEVTIKILD